MQPNIEINAALLLDAVGFPREAFTAVFAVARCAGWLAHAMEQQQEEPADPAGFGLCRAGPVRVQFRVVTKDAVLVERDPPVR